MAKAERHPITARDDTPLLHLCTRWHREYLALDISGADDALRDHRTELLLRTEWQIAEAAAQTQAGLLAKLAIYERNLFMIIDAENPDCAERLALSLIADVRRLLCRP